MLNYTVTTIYTRTSFGKFPAGYVLTVRDENNHVVKQFPRMLNEAIAHLIGRSYTTGLEVCV